MAAHVTNSTADDPVGRELDQEIEALRSRGILFVNLLAI